MAPQKYQCILLYKETYHLDLDESPKRESVADRGSYVLVPPEFPKNHPVCKVFESKNFQIVTDQLNLSLNENYELIEILLDTLQFSIFSSFQFPTCVFVDSYMIDMVRQLFQNSGIKVIFSKKRGVYIPAIDNNFKIFKPYAESKNINYSYPAGGSLIHFAVKLGHEAFVKFLLKYAYVDTKGEGNATPLHMSAVEGHMHIAKLLISMGAKVDSKMRDGSTPLLIACRKGKIELVQLFVEKGANLEDTDFNGMTPFLIAVNYGHVHIASYLLQQGAIITTTVIWLRGANALHLAVENNNLKIVKLLLETGRIQVDSKCIKGRTPLYFAVDRGHDQIIKYILTRRPNIEDNSNKKAFNLAFKRPNLEGSTIEKIWSYWLDVFPEDSNDPNLLYFGIVCNKFEVVRNLLRYGVDVNKPIFVTGRGRLTLLDCVLKMLPDDPEESRCVCQIRFIRLLLDHGFDSNSELNISSKTGRTPLFDALSELNVEVAEMFLDYKYNLDIRNGPNPLHFILDNDNLHSKNCTWIDKNRSRIVKLLILRGANLGEKSPETQKTPIRIAIECGYLLTFENLVEFGAEFSLADISGKAVQPLHMKTILIHYFKTLTADDKVQIPRIFDLCTRSCKFVFSRATIFAEHLCKINVIHPCFDLETLTIIQNFFLLDKGFFCLSEYEKKCRDEVVKLQGLVIGTTKISLYDILIKGIDGVSRFAKNSEFVRALNDHPFEFEIYGSILRNIFCQGVTRRELICDAMKMLRFLFPSFSALPDELKETVVYFLSNRDIINLKKCLKWK